MRVRVSFPLLILFIYNMKVIFLDFDGVITIPPEWHLDVNKIKYIKQIVDTTGAKIVVSSSWRMNSIEETIIDIYKNELPLNSKIFKWFLNNLYDVIPWVCDDKYNGTGRGGEIQTWLDKHPEVDNYVIIDDDGDMLDSQLFHFVQTNYEDGITELETNWCIKILNKKFFQNSMAINFTLRNEWINKCKGLPNRQEELWKHNDHCKDLKL